MKRSTLQKKMKKLGISRPCRLHNGCQEADRQHDYSRLARIGRMARVAVYVHWKSEPGLKLSPGESTEWAMSTEWQFYLQHANRSDPQPDFG